MRAITFLRRPRNAIAAGVSAVVLIGAFGNSSSDGGDGTAAAAVEVTQPEGVVGEPSASASTTAVPAPTPAPTTAAAVATPAPTTAPPATVPPTTLPPVTLPPTTTVPAFSVEELNASIAPAVQAWAAAPSGPSYDALATAARTVIDSGRPLPDLPGLAPGQTATVLGGLAAYPGSDTQVIVLLAQLGPAAPAVTLPPVTLPQPIAQFAETDDGGTDPDFGTCKEAKANGYGPYRQGRDPEYSWYRDADDDGVVCE